MLRVHLLAVVEEHGDAAPHQARVRPCRLRQVPPPPARNTIPPYTAGKEQRAAKFRHREDDAGRAGAPTLPCASCAAGAHGGRGTRGRPPCMSMHACGISRFRPCPLSGTLLLKNCPRRRGETGPANASPDVLKATGGGARQQPPHRTCRGADLPVSSTSRSGVLVETCFPKMKKGNCDADVFSSPTRFYYYYKHKPDNPC